MESPGPRGTSDHGGRLLTGSGTGALPAGLDRAALVAEVRRVCDAHLPRGCAVVVAVSGGPDSVALAYLVAEARSDLDLSVAHVRHGLRDDRSDAAVASAHAAALGTGYLERSVTVAGAGGPEAAAREVRYAALSALALRVGAVAVLVGHSADDQAETVLLNLARGSGLRGLSGMAERRDLGGLDLIRPLLRIRRGDIRRFVAGEGLAAVSDPTNFDTDQRRARARTRVLPALAGLTGGPGDPVGALTRLADLARDDAAALEAFAATETRRVAHWWGPAVCVRFDELEALPAALVGRVLRTLVRQVRGATAELPEVTAGVGPGDQGAQGPPAATVDALRALPAGSARSVEGGVWATSGGGWLALRPADVVPLDARTLQVPGRTGLPTLGLELRVDLPWGPHPVTLPGQTQLDVLGPAPPLTAAPAPGAGSLPSGAGPLPSGAGPVPPGARAHAVGAWVALPAEALPGLAVRARRPGDRLTLPHGTRKLQDLFTDHGVPRAIRDLVPVVVDADDRPLWVPGVAVRAFPSDRRAAARVELAPIR